MIRMAGHITKFSELFDYMPWTYKGIQKILKDKDYKKDVDIEDPYFINGYEPRMEKWTLTTKRKQ